MLGSSPIVTTSNSRGVVKKLPLSLMRKAWCCSSTTADAPARIFGEEVEARITGRGIQDHRVAGVYLTRYGDKLISTPPEGYEVLGYGTTEDICRRKGEHGRRFGDCDVLDFVPTYNGAVETQFQRYLRNQKRLIKGRVLGETTEVHELFIVKTDQEDYDKLYAALLAIEKSNPHPISREEEIRLEEMKARKAEAEAEKAKIDMEIKRVETGAQVEIARENAGAQVEIARENAGAQVAIAEAERQEESFSGAPTVLLSTLTTASPRRPRPSMLSTTHCARP